MSDALVNHHSSRLGVHPKCLTCVGDIFLTGKLLFLLLKTDTTFPKFEIDSLTAWSFTYSGRNNVIKIGSSPFLRGPYLRFWKMRVISLSPKRLWVSVTCNFSLAVFDSKIKINFEEEILYRVLILEGAPQFLILETFLGVLLSRVSAQAEISRLLEQRVSFKALCHTSLVRKLSKPARGGSRFSLGLKLQSSSEGRTNL